MGHPEQSNPFIAVMRRIHQEYDIGLANLPIQICAFLRRRRGIDYGGRDIFRSANGWWDCDLGEDWLDLCGDEDIFDERGNEA